MTARHIFKFGEFSLSVDERALQRGEENVSLTPKMYELLLAFVRHPDRVLEKEFLMQTVWPDSFVAEGSISFNIRQLRKALGDDAQQPTYIETVPRRGYRFVAKVEELVTEDGVTGPPTLVALPTTRQRASRLLLLVGASAAGLLVVGLAAAWFLVDRAVTSAPILSAPFTVERLSTDGQVHLIVISRDGTTVVYSRRNAGKQSLWVMQPGTTDNSQIVPVSDYSYFGLALSPDGKSIYYVRGLASGPQQPDIYRESIYGGVPQRIVSEAQGWINLSPDGKKISFVRCPHTEEEHCSLWIADASDGGNQRKLVSRPGPFRIGDNKISPDGRSIAFAVGQSRTFSNDFGVSLVDIETGAERELTKDKFFNVLSLAWLPGQQGLLMTARQEPDKNFRIWHVTPAGAATPLTDDAQTYSALSVSEDGSLLVTSQVAPNFHLTIYKTNDPGSGPRRLANALTVNYAPDGELLLSSPRTGNNEIWSIKSDGSGERQLTDDPADDLAPMSTPDGNSIFFASNRTGKVQIWKMNRDGSNQTQVTVKEGGEPSIVSPDGQWLYYKSAFEKKFMRVSLKDGHEEMAFDMPSQDATIAPTGDRIALTTNVNGENVLDVVSLPDGAVTKSFHYADPKAAIVSLVWSHDAKYLAYILSDQFGLEETLWFQPLDDEKPRKIADLQEETFELSNLALSPDDQTFAVIQGTWSHDAVLIRGLK